MRSRLVCLFVLLVVLCARNAAATPLTAGPLTFGDSFPFTLNGIFDLGNGSFNVQFEGSDLAVYAVGTVTYRQTTTFSFAVAPGWYVANIFVLRGIWDYELLSDSVPPRYFWGLESAQKVRLCPADLWCSYGGFDARVADATAFGPGFTAMPNVGYGTFEDFLYAKNVSVESVTPNQIDIIVRKLPHVPEPSSILLAATGMAGLFGSLRKKRLRVE